MASNWFEAPAPVARRVRAYFAPVQRALQQPEIFDPVANGRFDLDAPPTPWIDLGWIESFLRKSKSKSQPLLTGIPASVFGQVRETLEADVSFEFQRWTKLTMALATGSQHMNLLAGTAGGTASPVGTQAATAVAIQAGSTATALILSSTDVTQFSAGSLVAVDADYTGQLGFVGTPIAGAYVRQALSDVDYVRRITFNVGLVAEVNGGTLMLAQPLPGGDPGPEAKLQALTGFVDREGGSFYQEWSALFVIVGSQDERIFLHYPRLQPNVGAEETATPLGERRSGGQQRIALKASFAALPITDALDGERVLCYRSFLPAPHAAI
ncbi:MAG TPA: hypothetical protein VG844_09050 [Terracidiphilus sp.]|nr:hypothetical protein [Terracidiphilus sp.]